MDKRLFPLLVLVLFSFLFLFRSVTNITTIPFHDYDEAHRAEGARNMRLHNFFLSPLVGNPYSKNAKISFPYLLDETKTVYAQTGRPPLVFNLMAFSSSLFGDYEWVYRLPSLFLGLAVFEAIVLSVYFLAKKKPNLLALIVALLAIITSYDWWLSAQMAHLDTAVSLFTALAVFLLILFAQNKNKFFLATSGISLALAILSKGQPAVIFLFPLIYLLLIKKISLKETFSLGLTTLIVLSPWVISFDRQLGFGAWFKTYFGGYVASPSSTKIGGGDPTQAAPIFWYLRWWFDTLRPGIYLFGAFFLYDLVKKRLSWQKIALLAYIFGGFGLFSYAKSKVWWYVLPIIPAISIYLYLAISDYLKERKYGLINLSLAIFLASLPLFLFRTNTVSLAYGFITTALVFLILKLPITDYLLRITGYILPVTNYVLRVTCYLLPVARNLKLEIRNLLFILVLATSLSLFSLRFPSPSPTHYETKEVGHFFQTLPYPKCLWVEEDFPYEAILYYSRVGELDYLDESSSLDPNCQNYLVVSKNLEDFDLVYQSDPVRLYKIENY
ncbi:hypothetical protein COT77_00020 [Candidatus Berkelbacteria bacterium CG10_big_fil_rev_8_21_14_0_10_41_12]|uniref:Glycosyltransferase RgtA/B/C/D-like domain-containing protein n=1 Tax=Candidatus Berkelbacteria bacterium CG10_big_fil_rev_8_21_14_0_10_41_12 TaxID=1974513 RepID=A0A2M6WY55_9BACT|nr:MAG: hypothetical protein COT77_00020 [Candidatus Berkelbacteria bacterium CG10_big_fil_rev_8_21_14_0_10_41_12]